MTNVEIAVADYVDWINHGRLRGENGLVPPAEFEANPWANNVVTETLKHLSCPGLGFQATGPP